MSLGACKKALSEALREPLGSLGFEQAEKLDFVRATSSGGQTLRFGGRADDRGHCHVSGTAGVIFRELEAVLAHSGKSGGPLLPTFMVPFHLLHDDRKYFEWAIEREEDAPGAAAEILAEVEAYALPFFTRYRDIGALKEALESPNPPWFVLTPEQRLTTLAAIEHVSGAPKTAIRLLDDALAERRGALPKKRHALQRLREHLASIQ